MSKEVLELFDRVTIPESFGLILENCDEILSPEHFAKHGGFNARLRRAVGAQRDI